MKSLQVLCVSLLLAENQINCTNLGSKMMGNISIPAANVTNQVQINGLAPSLAPRYPD